MIDELSGTTDVIGGVTPARRESTWSDFPNVNCAFVFQCYLAALNGLNRSCPICRRQGICFRGVAGVGIRAEAILDLAMAFFDPKMLRQAESSD